MKQVICILLVASVALIPCLSIQGQEDLQKHEIGIRLESFNDFDFIYKKHRFDDKYLRFRAGNLGFGQRFTEALPTQQINSRSSSNTSIGFSLGWENRKSLTDELWFIHGFEPGISFESFSSELMNFKRSSFRSTAFLGYVLGFQYDFSDKFYIGIEAIPKYSFILESSSIDGVREGLIISNDGALGLNAIALNIVYKFSK